MGMQLRSDVLRMLLCFGSAFVTVILLRTVIWGFSITQSLAQAFVVALSIALGLAWIDRPLRR